MTNIELTPSRFTEIFEGTRDAMVLYADDHFMAMLDDYPITPGHTLVVPRQQVDKIDDLDPATRQVLGALSQIVGKRLETVLNPLRVTETVFGFGVPHAHIMRIPSLVRGDVTTGLIDKTRFNLPVDHDALANMHDRLAFSEIQAHKIQQYLRAVGHHAIGTPEWLEKLYS